jgi:hypothetical protein
VALTQRTARAVAMEHAIIGGLAGEGTDPPRPAALVDELAENLRAILRDMLCGHLEADLVSVADDLLAEAADAPVAESSDPAAGVR